MTMTEKVSLPRMRARDSKRLAATATAVAVLLGGTAIALAAHAATPDPGALPSISTARMPAAPAQAAGVAATDTADSSAISTASTMTITKEPPFAGSASNSPGSATQADTQSGKTSPIPAEESKPADADDEDDEDHETVAPPVREDDDHDEDGEDRAINKGDKKSN